MSGRPSSTPRSRRCCAPEASAAAKAHDRVFVPSSTHLAGFKQPVAGDPGEGLLEHLPGIGLKDDALAGAPAPRVHARMQPLGELGPVIVRVELWPHVDVALGAPQRAEELGYVLQVRIAV